MARKTRHRQLTENQMAAQEAAIPGIANRAFHKAYTRAIESGAEVLVVRDQSLVRVTKDSSEVLRTIDGFGKLKSGTRLAITRKTRKGSL